MITYPSHSTPEQFRLNEQARHVSTIMSHKILQSPVQDANGSRLLEAGCGTGYMTYRLGAQFPDAEVFGLDLSKVPEVDQCPPNVHFLQGNVLNQKPTEWEPQGNGPKVTDNAEAFDLIFGRFLIAGINDWPGLFKTQFQMLKPGGYAESHELDPLIYNKAEETTTDKEEWHVVFKENAEVTGLDFECAWKAKARMVDAGFVDVEVKEYPLPLGGEGEATPELQAAGDFMVRTFRDIRELVLRRFVEPGEQQERFVEDCNRAMAPAPGKHCKLVVTYGRKPS